MMGKKIKTVKIIPGCISCGSCEVFCPDVFEVKGIAEICENVDFNANNELVREAADMCPVNSIQIEESDEWDTSIRYISLIFGENRFYYVYI